MKIGFYKCHCGNIWNSISQEVDVGECIECKTKIAPLVKFGLEGDFFARHVIEYEKKIANLEELCRRAHCEIDEKFDKLLDDEGYGPLSLITDLEKVGTKRGYSGISNYMEYLLQLLKDCMSMRKQ